MDSAPELDAADGFWLDLAEFRADLRIASTDPRMPPEFFLDYRTGVLAVRALVDDEAAFCAVVEQSRDFDPAAFADFARAGDVRWRSPGNADVKPSLLLRCTLHIVNGI